MTMTDVETRLRADLPRLAEAIVREPAVGDVVALPNTVRRRRRPVVVAAVAACVALAVTVAALVVVTREVGDGVRTRPAGREPIVTEPGWHALPPAGLGPRGGVSPLWTGREVLVSGGYRLGVRALVLDGGAAYDPQTGTWRDLATAAAHPGAFMVWAGDRAVWFAKQGGGIYDPDSGESRAFPILRAGTSLFMAAASTGRDAYGVLGTAMGTPQTIQLARFDEPSNAWALGSAHPAPFESNREIGAIATGDEVITWDRHRSTGVAYAYSPATDTWRELELPAGGTDASTSLAWVDGRLVGVTASGSADVRSLSIAVLVDGEWAQEVVVPSSGTMRPLAVTDGRRLAIVDEDGVGATRLVELVGSGGAIVTWTDSPLRPGRWTAAVWIPNGLFVWGGLPSDTPATFDNPSPKEPEAAILTP
jgi:hypothetical protein